MAMQPDIQYVSFYVEGNAAKKLEQQLLRPAAAPKPRVRKVKRRVICVDPAAVLGLVVAVVMLFTMISGITQYRAEVARQQQMQSYVLQLQQDNAQLRQTYENGYDLDEIRDIALAVGMIPAEEAERITISVELPQTEQRQMTFWEKVTTFLTGLFA